MSLSIMNSKHASILMLNARIISPKRGSVLNTRSNDFIRRYIEHVMPRTRKNHFRSCCEG